jgi:hypothetical protein
MPCAPVPNGLGRTGFPFSLSWWLRRSCRWSGPGRTGSVTSSVTGHGLDAPMPARIRLVRAGRWRPSPGRVAEGAPSDHDARGLVPGGLPGGGAGGALPVLGAPPGGVGGVDGDDRDALLRGHGNKPGPQPGGREPGDQAPELLTATMFLAGLPLGEVEVLQADRDRAALAGPVQEPGGGGCSPGAGTSRATPDATGTRPGRPCGPSARPAGTGGARSPRSQRPTTPGARPAPAASGPTGRGLPS